MYAESKGNATGFGRYLISMRMEYSVIRVFVVLIRYFISVNAYKHHL